MFDFATFNEQVLNLCDREFKVYMVVYVANKLQDLLPCKKYIMNLSRKKETQTAEILRSLVNKQLIEVVRKPNDHTYYYAIV